MSRTEEVTRVFIAEDHKGIQHTIHEITEFEEWSNLAGESGRVEFQKRLETAEGQPVAFIYYEHLGNPPYYYTLLGGLEPVQLIA